MLGRGTLEGYLLARHRAIDALLERAIDQHGVTQVMEVACGLSPRGWRFARRYGERLDVHRDRSARDGGAQARGTRADRVAPRAPPRRRARRARTGGPGRLGRRARPGPGPGDHHRGAARLPAVGCRGRLVASFRGGPCRGFRAASTCPICTSAGRRRARFGRSGSCCRHSSGVECTCTSKIPGGRRQRSPRPGSPTPRFCGLRA